MNTDKITMDDHGTVDWRGRRVKCPNCSGGFLALQQASKKTRKVGWLECDQCRSRFKIKQWVPVPGDPLPLPRRVKWLQFSLGDLEAHNE